MKKAMIIVWMSCLAVSVYGQSFLHLTSNDGLPDNHARFVYQDNNGYIYAGTRIGMCRYDGYVFTIAEFRDPVHVPPREFSAMIQTRHGYFTVAATGIYEYNRFENSLELMKKLQLLDEACFIVYQGRVFCGNSAGLFSLDTTERKWIESNEYVSGIDQIHVRTMLVTRNNELLIGTNKGFFRYDENMELLGSKLGNDPLYHDINGMVEDSSGNFWISTFTNLYKLDASYRMITEYKDRFSNAHIRCLESDPYQRIWVGGEFGIAIIDSHQGELKLVHRDIVHEQGLNDNAVYSIFRDAAGNMWIGTYFGGINLWNGDFDKFKAIYPGDGNKNTSGKVVREMQEDATGNLWLALEDGGLNYLNTKTGDVTRFFYSGENDYKNIHSIILEKDLIWIGSFNSGLECFSIHFRNNVPELKLVSSQIPDEMVFDIDRDSLGNIYAGSAGQVYRLDRASGTIQPLHEEAFNSLIIYTLKVISETDLLLGTLRNGLYHYNRKTGIASSFSRHEAFSGMQTISFIGEKEQHGYLIACSDGLYNYDPEGSSLTRVVEDRENIEFRAVIRDDSSGFWISTTNGLLYSDPSRSLLKNYNRYDGLPENQFNFNSAYRASDGKYYFGTYNGLISFYPEEVKQLRMEIPKVSFTGYTVVGDDKTSLDNYFLDNTVTELRLKPYQTLLSLEFSTLGYSRTKDIGYQIRMVGESQTWDQMEKGRSVTLTNLAPGWHQLEVRAAVNGVVSAESTLLSIYRQPAAWQTVYAYILYGLTLIVIFLLIRKDFLRRQHTRHALALERFEKANEKKLNEQKMRFFINISHEFRTPLTIIGGTITNILQKFIVDRELGKKLEIIQNTSENLNKLVDDFLEYGKLDAGFKPLEMKKGAIMQFIRKACDMFDNWAEVNQVCYKKEIDDQKEIGFFDPFKIERILYNLLSNAFKFNASRGEISVEARIVRHSKTSLILVVKDSGPGMDSETLARLSHKFTFSEESENSGKEIGLSYTAGLVHQLGGSIHVKSVPAKGSAFTVELPILLSQGRYEDFSDAIEPALESEEISKDLEVREMLKDKSRADILLIDDNKDLLAMLSDSLSSAYNIVPVANPVKALELSKQQDFELIICDIMMPEMNGFEVIDKLHSNILTSHVPILVLTAAADRKIEMKGYRKGAVSYLSKPFQTEELRIKIDSILSLRRELILRYSSSEELSASAVTYTLKDEEFLRQAHDVVMSCIDDINFDVDKFCSDMKVSRTLLHTKLKKITGLSTTEFIRSIRLRQAYVYLKKGGFTVSEIAYKCGFNDANYFSKCFKKQYNIFPSKMNKSR